MTAIFSGTTSSIELPYKLDSLGSRLHCHASLAYISMLSPGSTPSKRIFRKFLLSESHKDPLLPQQYQIIPSDIAAHALLANGLPTKLVSIFSC